MVHISHAKAEDPVAERVTKKEKTERARDRDGEPIGSHGKQVDRGRHQSEDEPVHKLKTSPHPVDG